MLLKLAIALGVLLLAAAGCSVAAARRSEGRRRDQQRWSERLDCLRRDQEPRAEASDYPVPDCP